MRGITASLGAGIILAMAEPAYCDERAKEVQAFMGEYLRFWNAGDAKTIAERFYRFDRPNPWRDVIGLRAEFERRRAQGCSAAAGAGLESRLISRTEALTELRQPRIKTVGAAASFADISALYFAREFQDGWRITNYIPMSPTANLNYKLAAE